MGNNNNKWKSGILLPLLSRRGHELEEGEIYLILLRILALANQFEFACWEKKKRSDGEVVVGG